MRIYAGNNLLLMSPLVNKKGMETNIGQTMPFGLPGLPCLACPSPVKAVLDNNGETWPFLLLREAHHLHDFFVNSSAVRLFQAYNQYSRMSFIAVLRKSFVRRDQESMLILAEHPKVRIKLALALGAADVLYVMAVLAKAANGHYRDVLIDKDFHTRASSGMTCSSVRSAA